MQNNATEQVCAGFFVRLAAYIVDAIIVGVVLLAVRFPLWILRLADGDNFIFQDLIFKFSIKDILLYLLTVTYFILLTYFTGATLGKHLFHIRVVSAENRDFTFFEIVFRETVGKFLSAVIIYVGYLMVLVSREKTGLHDILSDTRVVYSHVKKVKIDTPITYKNMPDIPPYGMPPQGNMPPQNNMYPNGMQQPYGEPQPNNAPLWNGMQQPYGESQPNNMPSWNGMQQPYGEPQQDDIL